MTYAASRIPPLAAAGMMILSRTTGFATPLSRLLALLTGAAALAALLPLSRRGEASPIDKTMGGYAAGIGVALLLSPADAVPFLSRYSAAALYLSLLATAVLPPLLGKPPFTVWFARRQAPEAVCRTNPFRQINRRLTGLWALLFAIGAASASVPGILGHRGPLRGAIFELILPGILMLGIGLLANRLYPSYLLRKSGIPPMGGGSGPPATADSTATPTGNGLRGPATHSHEPGSGAIRQSKEERKMSMPCTVVALNGSPHAGAGNTSLLLGMLGEALTAEGIVLETIHLCNREIEYCIGCAHCLEKGRCWIPDDHAGIAERLLAADGIVLASPVYFNHVTAQMKTFIDRSLALGHKPRGNWKPGLAVSVSAGMGETQVADYLAAMLRPYGAFPVGRLTALAAAPGEFLGKDAAEARAADLARDLARAIREKRRYPATEWDLRYYRFMGNLVRENRGQIMKDDYDHWERLGLYEGFETYIGQKKESVRYDPELRKAWLKETIAEYKARKHDGVAPELKGRPAAGRPAIGAPPSASCREVLRSMPLDFSPEAAGDLSAVYQFEIDGAEEFTAHLRIGGGRCTFHDGPADRPSVVIRSPAEVWLAISRGELDGSSAFMAGKYRGEGDLSLLLRLGSLFRR